MSNKPNVSSAPNGVQVSMGRDLHEGHGTSAQELKCWHLADKLRTAVIAICSQDKVAQHLRFCDGFTRS